jgi:hypothetical protein
MTIAFSTHIANAYKKAQMGPSIVSKDGAGEGDENAY